MAEEEELVEEEVEAAGESASTIPDADAEEGDFGEFPVAEGVSGRW